MMSRTNVHSVLQIEDAIKIFQDMINRGCERNVITYSSLISACEKSGKWELALELFDEMHKDACKPNIVTYNALIAACGQGNHHLCSASQFLETSIPVLRLDTLIPPLLRLETSIPLPRLQFQFILD